MTNNPFGPRSLTIHLGPDKAEDPVLRISRHDDDNWHFAWAWKHRYPPAYTMLVNKHDLELTLAELDNALPTPD